MAVYTKPISGSQLIAGIVGTIGLDNILATAIDIVVAGKKRDELNARWRTEYEQFKDWLTFLAKKSPSEIIGIARANYQESVIQKLNWTHYIGEMAKAGGICGSLAQQLWGELYNLRGYGVCEEIAIGIPGEHAIKKAQREWNLTFRDSRPSPKDLFRMYAKGYIKEDTFRRMLLEETGIEKELEAGFVDLLDVTPSPSELVRMRRVMPLDDKYIEQCLRENGVVEPDLSIYKNWIKLEGLKDELSSLWRYVLSEYQQGFLSSDELTAFLQSLPASKEEVSLRLTVAQLLRRVYTIKLLRDKWIYLFRNGKITPDDLYAKLKEVGLDDAVANAITQLECAKKGVDWSK